MIEINRENHSYARCQACGAYKEDSEKLNVYSIKIINKNRQGTEISLCNNCCNILSDLTNEPDRRMYGMKAMSYDELEEG